MAEHKKRARRKATGIDGVDKTVYYTILDSMESIKKSPVASAMLTRMMDKVPPEKLLKQAGKSVTPAMVKQLNAALNHIPRVE